MVFPTVSKKSGPVGPDFLWMRDADCETRVCAGLAMTGFFKMDLIFGGSKFPGGQVAEFDLDAFIGGGFGGFLQEFFSIFV